MRELLNRGLREVRAFDCDETGLFNLEHDLNSDRLCPVIGDVRDPSRVAEALEDVSLVYHLAALKHVETCELEALEAVKTNIIGTANLINGALCTGVHSRFLTISTDKVVYPVGIYAATKLIAEIMTIQANNSFRNKRTLFSAVRFGNIFDTRGSVFDIWRKQKAENKPLTVTDERMVRFFWPMSAAVKFILQVTERMEGGEIFVPTMPSFTIIELAKKLSDKIIVMGIRPGESLTHRLMTTEEEAKAVKGDGMWIIK